MSPKSELLGALQMLKDAIQKLPISTPKGAPDGIIGRNFTSLTFLDAEDSVWETVDRAYTRCFSKTGPSDMPPKENVLSGPFGMDLVLHFLEAVSESSKINSSNIFLFTLKINQLTDLVHARIQSLPPDHLLHQNKTTRAKGKHGRKAALKRFESKAGRPSAPTREDSDDDCDYAPAVTPPDDSPTATDHNTETSEGSGAQDTDHTRVATKAKAQQKRPQNKRKGSSGLNKKRPAKKTRTRSANRRIVSNGSDSDTDDERDAKTKADKSGAMKAWALARFEDLVPGRNPATGKRVWIFKCWYCTKFRRIARTKGCCNISEETNPFTASNFTAHLRECKTIPADDSWAAFAVRKENKAPRSIVDDSTNLGAMFAASEPTNVQEYRNPVIERKGKFRSNLIQGVIHDNYPLTFGEGQGMIGLFGFVSPDLTLPVHLTMRRDLDKLHGLLSWRVKKVVEASGLIFYPNNAHIYLLFTLKTQTSLVAISSDAWSSKSSVYSLAGIVVSFIDSTWSLYHLPIDVVNLNAEHSGISMGKRVFETIQHHGVGANIIASVTDNAFNNRTMNAEIIRRYEDKFGNDLHIDNISVGCVAHAIHLVCSAILSEIGAMDLLENKEAYAIAKLFDPEECYKDNQETADVQARLDKECDPTNKEDPPADASDDEGVQSGTGSKTGRHKKLLNAVKKVHVVAVHATGSPARRRRFWKLTRTLCEKALALVKSMYVRWNSVLAELCRALALKPAINQWILTLDEGLKGRAQVAARARKQKWTISDHEWDLVALLVALLEKNAEASLALVLPTYAALLDSLDAALQRIDHKHPGDPSGIKEAILAGCDKLLKYIKIARSNQLVLIALSE
ncbi:hypothetical protein FRC07_002411 [Ceratobasidium sp. 392]|nr:hypothetical protein FRC07_002411 [Ceratobasidium sp. 392]